MKGISDIPVFIAVAETHGFASAARRLGVSKSAVSKRITLMEQRLDAQLFHRSTRNVSLTEAGEHYFSRAILALEAAQEAEECVQALQGSPKGRLRINVPMSFGRLHVAPLIPEFLNLYSGLEVDMVMDDRVVDLFADRFDVALRGGTLEDSSLVARKITPLRNYLVAAPSYVEQKGTPQSPMELGSYNCLQYSLTSDFPEWIFETPDATLKVPVRGNYKANNGEALHEAILGGAGIGRLPTFITGSDLSSGRLLRILPDYPMPTQTLYAIYPTRRYLPTKVRAFVDFMIARIGGDIPPWDQVVDLQ